jgi:hypothetical protein
MRKVLRYLVLAAAAVVVVIAGAILVFLWQTRDRGPAVDEAMAAGKKPSDFPHAANDFFHDMDGGIPLTAGEVKGRNTWLVWTGGNEAFWDWLASNSFGTFDLLKTLSSYPCSAEQQKHLASLSADDRKRLPDFALFRREGRFKHLGVMNEPGFRQATAPDEFGLCLDQSDRSPDFDERVYGRAAGVLGLRIYPNPNFDAKARQRWDANKQRYYTDPAFYSDGTLVRPYRVGMSCAFCHISHHPLYPPADPENPEFRNLSATIGAQYFWFGRIFASNLTPDNFVWHVLDSNQPGAVDTSLLPTDHIVNPRAMNAIFDLPARMAAAKRFHKETMAGRALDLPEVQKVKSDTGDTTFGVPQILWDGADSVGMDAALTRVYINIGEYHQEWIRHIQPLVGGRPQTPIEVKVAVKNSTYWNATQERSHDLAAYLIRASGPMRLKDAPGGAAYLRVAAGGAEDPILTRGKVVFAENCARCHSSKLPAPAPGLDESPTCGGAQYLECWDRFWKWTETEEFKAPMRQMALAPDFLDNNYLSTDARIPVTTLETEICSAMASNAIEGYVWDNFSSQSYKSLPAVGKVTLHDPVQGTDFTWDTPGGGRGYQRVPSLVSIWSTAPLLHNNEVGVFTNDPSTAGRMSAFDDAIRKLLHLKPRDNIVRRTRAVGTSSSTYGPDRYSQAGTGGQSYAASYQPEPGGPSYDGTTWLSVYTSAFPPKLQLFVGDNRIARGLRRFIGAGSLVEDGLVKIGPIPEGTPVSLLANLNVDRNDPRFSVRKLLKLLNHTKQRLKRIEDEKLDKAQATALLRELAPELRALSTCPDFIVDRGHNFGRQLPDADKEALIEFVKTF